MTGVIAPLVGLGLGLGLGQASLLDSKERIVKKPAAAPRDLQGFEWTARKSGIRKAIAEALKMKDATISEVKGYLRSLNSTRIKGKKAQEKIDDLLKLDEEQLQEYVRTVKTSGKFETSAPQSENIKIDSDTEGFLKNNPKREMPQDQSEQPSGKRTKIDVPEPAAAEASFFDTIGNVVSGIYNARPMMPQNPQDEMAAPIGGDPLIEPKPAPPPPKAVEREIVFRIIQNRPQEVDPREYLNPQPGPTIAEITQLGGEPDGGDELNNFYGRLHALRNNYESLPESKYQERFASLPPPVASAPSGSLLSQMLGFELPVKEQQKLRDFNEGFQNLKPKLHTYTKGESPKILFRMVGDVPEQVNLNEAFALRNFADPLEVGLMMGKQFRDAAKIVGGANMNDLAIEQFNNLRQELIKQQPGEIFEISQDDFNLFAGLKVPAPVVYEPNPNTGQPIPTVFSRPVPPPFPVPPEMIVDPTATPALDLSRVAAAAAWDVAQSFAQGGGAYLAANTFGPAGALFYNAAFSRLAPALQFLDTTRGYSENVGVAIARDFIRPLVQTSIPPSAHATQILNPLQTQTDTARTSVNVQDVYSTPAVDGIALGQRDFQSWYVDTFSRFAVR